MQTIKETRRYQYEYHSKKYPYVDDWKNNPYTFLKARFYMEVSAILVYFLLKTKIKPNTVTIIYGLAGILGCILLAIPMNLTHILAAVVFFSKGILDWSDGHLARVTEQTSITGHVLDTHGAILNHVCFQIGLGFYVVSKTDAIFYYYLIPLIPFFYAANLKSFSDQMLFIELLKEKFLKNQMGIFSETNTNRPTISSENIKANILGKYNKCFDYFFSFLDARARNVDLICLLLLFEIFMDISVIWIVFILFVVKGLILFMGGYYVIVNKHLVEKTLDSFLRNIHNLIRDVK
jgi:CDP-alcohol phosphatidyltransferase